MGESKMMALFRKVKLYFYTLRPLKFVQVYYQVFYRFKKVLGQNRPSRQSTPVKVYPVNLMPSIPASPSWKGHEFSFLNQKKTFPDKVDWNFSGYGKLWTYNLNYFDFLTQENVDEKSAVVLLQDYCAAHLRDGIEPYPISLRGINWIKFMSANTSALPGCNARLFQDYIHLRNNPEYHLLGNHLLENGFSLLFGAYYFRSEYLYRQAERIIKRELAEQVLPDGAHFELSPMYHQILLFRLLDSINLVRNNEWKHRALDAELSEVAVRMVGWLRAVSFQNGHVPMVNDSAFHIAPSAVDLLRYAERLGLTADSSRLAESGYRMIRVTGYELFVDIGDIGPDYIPGHAHSDTLNFLLYFNGEPIIVDVGTSTYEANAQRLIERSTRSHNTVMVNDQEQSQVWASFRVGRRAKVIERCESPNEIYAVHDGYKSAGFLHKRLWRWSEKSITIRDEVKGSGARSIAFFHFHPSMVVKHEGNVLHAGPIRMQIEGAEKIELTAYMLPSGFNVFERATVAQVRFANELHSVITH